jgi:hypothetical protein
MQDQDVSGSSSTDLNFLATSSAPSVAFHSQAEDIPSSKTQQPKRASILLD